MGNIKGHTTIVVDTRDLQRELTELADAHVERCKRVKRMKRTIITLACVAIFVTVSLVACDLRDSMQVLKEIDKEAGKLCEKRERLKGDHESNPDMARQDETSSTDSQDTARTDGDPLRDTDGDDSNE